MPRVTPPPATLTPPGGSRCGATHNSDPPAPPPPQARLNSAPAAPFVWLSPPSGTSRQTQGGQLGPSHASPRRPPLSSAVWRIRATHVVLRLRSHLPAAVSWLEFHGANANQLTPLPSYTEHNNSLSPLWHKPDHDTPFPRPQRGWIAGARCSSWPPALKAWPAVSAATGGAWGGACSGKPGVRQPGSRPCRPP